MTQKKTVIWGTLLSRTRREVSPVVGVGVFDVTAGSPGPPDFLLIARLRGQRSRAAG